MGRHPLVPLLALTLGLGAGPVRVSYAQWTTDGVPLCLATSGQVSPTIVSDGAGGAIIAWEDGRSGTSTDIYAQRVDAAGVAQWTVNGVGLCTTANHQDSPAIVSDGAGGAIIAWRDSRSGNLGVYAQRVDAAGAPQWTPNGVAVCLLAGAQYGPTMVSDGAGGAIVTWEDFRSGTSRDIYAQHVSASGAVDPASALEGVGLCTAPGDQKLPTIASDGSGGAIVTWYDGRGVTSWDIYAQRVGAGGMPQWTANGVALCTAPNGQFNGGIISDGAGGAIVTWDDRRSGGSDIYAQHVLASGAMDPAWTANGVAVCTAAGGQQVPSIVSDGVGGFIVAWEDARLVSGWDIFAQRMDAAGVPQWPANGVALCTAPNYQFSPKIVSDGAGGAIVTWYDYRNTETDIYAQRVDAAGIPQWPPDGAALCIAPNAQAFPSIASDGAGGPSSPGRTGAAAFTTSMLSGSTGPAAWRRYRTAAPRTSSCSRSPRIPRGMAA